MRGFPTSESAAIARRVISGYAGNGEGPKPSAVARDEVRG